MSGSAFETRASSFPGSARERTACEAPPRLRSGTAVRLDEENREARAEPEEQGVPGQSPGTRCAPGVVALIALCVLHCGCGAETTPSNPPVPTAPGTARDDEAPQGEAKPFGASDARTASDRRPDIVLISLDTVRADRLGCYGGDPRTTPHLDRFAAASVRFDLCRTQSTWTLPAHMALFTGLLPSHNGVDQLAKVLPADVPTLPELLRDAGYSTTALVNNGQMRAHWGFARGFDTWREFEVDTPEGNCERITSAALEWWQQRIRRKDDRPAFLFLHYYDAHDPYDAPAEFKQRAGTTLTGREARELCFGHRFPGTDLPPETRRDLLAAYDADLAWLDREVGRLLEALPEQVLVVVFSDHGECFEEHGWTLHGATLFEEELRVPLLVRWPGLKPRVVDEPVLLLDVAPTLLAAADEQAPARCEGRDLRPAAEGRAGAARWIPAETKAVPEGRCLWSVSAGPLKATYSLFDRRFTLHRLPDESRDLLAAGLGSTEERAAADSLLRPLREWVAEESFWLLHAAGKGDREVRIDLAAGRFALVMPVGFDAERDTLIVSPDGRELRWVAHPRAEDEPLTLMLQLADEAAEMTLDVRIDGAAEAARVFLGAEGKSPAALPCVLDERIASSPPVVEGSWNASQSGIHVRRHARSGRAPRSSTVAPLDERTREQLRSLGYVR